MRAARVTRLETEPALSGIKPDGRAAALGSGMNPGVLAGLPGVVSGWKGKAYTLS
jgi:hypothetical protein